MAIVELGVGLLAAVVTSIPMLGPVVLLLFSAGIEAGSDGSRDRPAHALAMGAALAEGVHVALVVYGVAPRLLSLPEVAVWLRAIAGLVLIGLGVLAWRARGRPRPWQDITAPRAFALGVGLVLMNPGFLVTWIAVVAFASSHVEVVWGAPFIAGAVLGVLAWFGTVLWLARRLGPRLEPRLTRVRAIVALGIAALGVWLCVVAVVHLSSAPV